MKNNAFTDIILNWERMSKTKKLQRLQDFENMMARFQGRKPRSVTTKVDPEFVSKIIGDDRDAVAFYDRSDGTKINILTLDIDALEAIRNTIHEGFHAYIADFLAGKSKILKTYSKVDAEKFYKEEENLPSIHAEFYKTGRMPLYDSLYIEERINHKENSLTLLKMIFDSIDSVRDAVQLQSTFVCSLVHYAENERRGRKFERQYGVKYDDVVASAISKDNYEKEPIDKTGKFVCDGDERFLKFFDEATKLYIEYAQINESPLMSPSAKEAAIGECVEKLSLLYKEYVLQMLRTKKKI